jgi:RNA polymerase sigma factor (sigma-70 family)
MQELPVRKLHLQGRSAREGRRVLLRRDLHLRSELRVPELVRMSRDQGQVSELVPAFPTVAKLGWMKPVPADHLPPPRASHASDDAAASLVRELMADRSAFLAFLRARSASPADAEDVFQQSLLKAAQHAGDVRDPERRRAWFFQIMRRTLADEHARAAAAAAKIAALGPATEEPVPEERPICGCCLRRLEELRADYADILRRVDLGEEPLADVAAALGITVNNATVRLHRARKALRDQLRAFCGTDSARACADCGCDVP